MQRELKLRMWLLGLAIFICALFRPNVGAAQANNTHDDSTFDDELIAAPAEPVASIKSFVKRLKTIPAGEKTNVSKFEQA